MNRNLLNQYLTTGQVEKGLFHDHDKDIHRTAHVLKPWNQTFIFIMWYVLQPLSYQGKSCDGFIMSTGLQHGLDLQWHKAGSWNAFSLELHWNFPLPSPDFQMIWPYVSDCLLSCLFFDLVPVYSQQSRSSRTSVRSTAGSRGGGSWKGPLTRLRPVAPVTPPAPVPPSTLPALHQVGGFP